MDPTPAAPDLVDDPRLLLHYAHDAVRRSSPAWLRSRCEDIGQALVVRLLQRRRESNDVTITPAYVAVAARRAVAGELRLVARRRAFWDVHAPLLELAATAMPTPCDRALQCARVEIERLGPEACRAVTSYLGGEHIKVIAARMGWDTKRANNTVFRGLARVRGRLAARGITLDALAW